MPARFSVALLIAASATTLGCEDARRSFRDLVGRPVGPPDSLPQLLNDSLPFQYPVGLYLQLIDDSVTLRIHVDEYGKTVPESTRVEVPAKHAAFDTSALMGSRDLVFRPALRKGKPMPYTVLFPIQFKIPTVPRAPGDTAASK